MLAQSIASCPDFRSDQSSRPRGNTRSLKSALIAALKAAGASRDLGEVRRIHGVAIQRGLLQSDVFVANSVISMYAKCGSMEEAREVFQGMGFRDVVSWNALIGGYAEAGGPGSEIALGYFEQFQRENGCSSSSRTFVAAVKACAGLAAREEATLLDGRVLVKKRSLERGMVLHSQAAKDGFERDLYVSSSLVDMYAKCGSLLDARRIFERMPERNAVSWTALISGYAESGDGETALEIFERFFRSFQVDGRALVAAIKACGCVAVKEKASLVAGQVVKMLSLERGMAIHSMAGSETDIFVASSLVDMYAKCGRMEEARRVFDGIPGRDHDVVLWTSLIQGYAENDELDLAFGIFASGVGFHGANSQTFVAVLKACSGLASIEQLTQVEGKLVKIKSLQRAV
ncbi:pentatricopeptide repeat-containing protein At3g09040, mitochondrial-like isoform X1 [Selaginella moellendorffii]|uniref:pentatricopeptide repeat-containing protein At3g09040, mitochondrial-like isoform X1 n=1 Tax=Selaginella moellendorffii TaxID=88036 RepID=UPI000D1CA567|nr:pentatricopeptide repeat-containing protein At3g09040, mitochondrial-like isoform X1 [Selaginella moellendorffii]|eukprot:XP_024540607.1 pentatricopeptide repeat-containing protein At3g09040, mitochondrial-like isoform X1 [Selaginella moellendorffii]